jgi:hypothetical protein
LAISGTAANGEDYTTIGTTKTISSGATSATITITPIDDTSIEGSETIIFTIISGASYTIGSSLTETVTIVDNDVAPPTSPSY